MRIDKDIYTTNRSNCAFSLNVQSELEFNQVAFVQDTHLLLTGGFEKTLRIFDLNRPDAPPREVDDSPGSVRTVAWLHSDQTILSSCTDSGGVRYAQLLMIDQC